MKYPIIVLGPGRCGSTLLQRILNTSEQITIWGEHSGFLSNLADSYYQLTESNGMEKNFYGKSINPKLIIGSLTNYKACPNWINAFDKQSIADEYRQMIIRLLNNHYLDLEQIHFGFKEIRYTKDDQALNMWLELFPDSKQIFSMRNPFDVIRSMIVDWEKPAVIEEKITSQKYKYIKNRALKYAQRWNNVAGSILYWINEKKVQGYIEQYEHLLADPEKYVHEIFDFLQLPVPNNALQPLQYKIGSKKKEYIIELKHLIYQWSDEIWSLVGNNAEDLGYTLRSVDSYKKEM